MPKKNTVTSNEVADIISGDAIEITLAYPLEDREPGAKWFIKQPTDWQYDMGMTVYDAAAAEAMAMPELEGVKQMPPSDGLIALVNRRRGELEKSIADYKAKELLTAEEDLSLKADENLLAGLIDLDTYTRADEIVRDRATRARDMWYVRYLVVDGQGELLFKRGDEAGDARWERLGRTTKENLRLFVTTVLNLVTFAKN